ncbi:efflux RND transporter permease subunit, partial [Escherichia coli]|uniref:efflux RND transporter permease subunit n=1 Tax=Escherichia coli TaxID=562 RepID=UPI000BC60C34
SLQSSLPEGVEVVTTYDRSQLIDRAIDNLSHKLLGEFIVVALVCALFLWHVRSALVAIIVAAKQPAGRGGSGHYLRPQPAYRPRHRQPQPQA